MSGHVYVPKPSAYNNFIGCKNTMLSVLLYRRGRGGEEWRGVMCRGHKVNDVGRE